MIARLALRFALGRWLGVLMIPALSALGNAGLTALARRLGLSELDRQLVVWLRAPLSIFISRLITELAAGRIMRLQLPTAPWRESSLAARIESLCAAHKIKRPGLRAISLSGLRYFQIKNAGGELFVTEGLEQRLSAADLDFLILRELAVRPLHQVRNRLIYISAVAAALLPPYLLAVQATPYAVATRWILPVWGALFAALFVLSAQLRLRFVREQELDRDAFALERLRLASDRAAEAWNSLERLNGPRSLSGLLLPAPPRLESPSPSRLQRRRPGLTPRLARLAGFATLACAIIFLRIKPRYALRAAAARGDTARVAALLNAGLSPGAVDLVSNGMTPLIAAAQGGRLETARLLLSRGADPNQFHPLRLSALLLASEKGDLPMVQALIDAGADVNFKGTRGYTPLMLAAVHGRLQAAALLLDRGARIDERSRHRSTALLLAVQAAQAPMAAFLIERGAAVNAKDADGDDALTLARRKKLAALAALIENRSAPVTKSRLRGAARGAKVEP